MKDAARIVEMLLETETVRVCPYCEQERPVQVGPGQSKSHGICCRRHLEKHLQYSSADNPELQAQLRDMYSKQPDEAFSPDAYPQ